MYRESEEEKEECKRGVGMLVKNMRLGQTVKLWNFTKSAEKKVVI